MNLGQVGTDVGGIKGEKRCWERIQGESAGIWRYLEDDVENVQSFSKRFLGYMKVLLVSFPNIGGNEV